MAEPSKRRLPATVRNVPWPEFRKQATTVFLMLQAGWTALTPQEREEARKLVTKSKGRPRNLTKLEARRLGKLAAKAARAAANERSRRSPR
ncbi:hypothetical protein DVA67_017735 [Solirubrobacter sp. CPCC 204708]|uniref:Uncharacterized protein n=1 Tax=Solirubrobacter deserti TaxID=2282478 RepID=A0ABT4RCX3_9ACTN|nr:hypothetical protein [Solirubrobacter deserti]MBE2317828.1 hypothetical protein [Solirubrobacter deserti]MDA0136395.1 hypothetical protein [Solirubrobacter deserti]